MRYVPSTVRTFHCGAAGPLSAAPMSNDTARDSPGGMELAPLSRTMAVQIGDHAVLDDLPDTRSTIEAQYSRAIGRTPVLWIVTGTTKRIHSTLPYVATLAATVSAVTVATNRGIGAVASAQAPSARNGMARSRRGVTWP